MVEDHDQVALLLEVAAALAAASALKSATASVFRWTTAQWGVLFGAVHGRQSGPQFDRFIGQLERKLRALPHPDLDAALEYARHARILGVVQGFREAGVTVPVEWIRHPEKITAGSMLAELEKQGVPRRVLREARRDISRGTRSRLSKARKDALDRLDRAAKQVHALAEASLTELTKAAAPAQTAGTITESTARSAAVEELNRGIKAAAEAEGARVFWISERDGNVCPWCASLSGTFPGPDGIFTPHGFGHPGPVPYRLDVNGEKIPLTVPGLHPHCRCRLGIWRSKTPPGLDSYPLQLRREAQDLILSTPDATETALAPTPATQLLTLVASRSRARRGRPVPSQVLTRARRTLRASTRRRTGRR
jgi:hypothetical protein